MQKPSAELVKEAKEIRVANAGKKGKLTFVSSEGVEALGLKPWVAGQSENGPLRSRMWMSRRGPSSGGC